MAQNNLLSGSLIVGYDFSAKDKGVLIIGKKAKGEAVKVINAYEGKEAYDLFQKLISKGATSGKEDIHH